MLRRVRVLLTASLTIALACGSHEKSSGEPLHVPHVVADASAPALDVAAKDAAPNDAALPMAPPRWQFTVLSVQSDHGGSLLVIGGGSDQGIAKTWHATLIDTQGRAVSGGELVLIGVTRTTCTARSKLDPGQAQRYAHARIEPP